MNKSPASESAVPAEIAGWKAVSSAAENALVKTGRELGTGPGGDSCRSASLPSHGGESLSEIGERMGEDPFSISQWSGLEGAIEAIPAIIALLDADGVIIRVNSAWTSFMRENGGSECTAGIGCNYLATCDAATGPDSEYATAFASGIRSVIQRTRERFSLEYPCHSPGVQRWFVAHVTAFRGGGPTRAVIAHVDVSEQKRIQEQIRVLNLELEDRVLRRTRALKSVVARLEQEISKRQRLEREILEISEREQCRIGQDLHDGLGQELAGIAMMAEVLANQLKAESHPAFENVLEISSLTRNALVSAKSLSKGLYPVELSRYGLILALEVLAQQTSKRFGVRCELRQTSEAPDFGDSVAIHIYRIMQEAVQNAIRHGKADGIVIESSAGEGFHTFTVTDDGVGFDAPVHGAGMGMQIMEYRSRVMGATFRVEKPSQGGCRVICRVPCP
ncbi:MAG: sensor histidine kinase [Akkermansiaceae bacterium]